MGKLLKSYFFWTYDRGSIHFDIMVTAILLFMFVSPRFIDFKDRPVETVALHSSEVLVKEAGMSGDRPRFIYQIRADNMGNALSGGERRRVAGSTPSEAAGDTPGSPVPFPGPGNKGRWRNRCYRVARLRWLW